MTFQLTIPKEVDRVLSAGGLLAINHSAGKDSQAMTLKLLGAGIPRDQIVIVHAHLGRFEWPGTIAHIKATTPGQELIIARARKSFFEMVRARGMFPSPQYRQCTSDLKRSPIERELRAYLKANPRFGGQIVSAMGMRAQESPNRAKRCVMSISERNSKAGRHWINWLPIHAMREDEVFATLAVSGQEPHWAYAKGMSRLSCSFCIMASQRDLGTAARLRPKLYRDYCRLERDIDHTLHPSGTPLPELIGK